MSPGACARAEGARRFPRVSGDEPLQPRDYVTLSEFSPREWG